MRARACTIGDGGGGDWVYGAFSQASLLASTFSVWRRPRSYPICNAEKEKHRGACILVLTTYRSFSSNITPSCRCWVLRLILWS